MKTAEEIFNKHIDFNKKHGNRNYSKTKIINAMEEYAEQQVKNFNRLPNRSNLPVKAMLPEFENQLEQEATLISEAVADVIIIARLNDEETARKLIRKQFVVINRQDVEGN